MARWTCDFCALYADGLCPFTSSPREPACMRFVNRYDVQTHIPRKDHDPDELPQPRSTDPPAPRLITVRGGRNHEAN
jgi:hypothetical protein